MRFILSCKNMDGGFGCTPGGESHAGQSMFIYHLLWLSEYYFLISAQFVYTYTVTPLILTIKPNN